MRYILFAGATCYPNGGFEDFKGSGDELNVLVDCAEKLKIESKLIDWWHILDTVTMEIVEEY